jgi:hypothetical protein
MGVNVFVAADQVLMLILLMLPEQAACCCRCGGICSAVDGMYC